MLDDESDGEGEIPTDGIWKDLATASIRPPIWVIEGVLPIGLTFIAGPPKSMKSTFAMALTALATNHQCRALPPFMSVVQHTGPALILSAEATDGELRHMMEEGLSVKPLKTDWILVADDPFAFRLDDPDGLSKMMYWLDQRDPRIVVADPLRDLHEVDENDSGDMIRLLRPLRQWAIEHESAFVFVHHTRKPSDGQGTYDVLDVRGSGAIFGKADGALILTPRQGGAIQIRATFKRGPAWDKTIVLSAYGKQGGETMDELDVIIISAVNAGAVNLPSLVQSVRAAQAVIKSHLDKLKANGFARPDEKGNWEITEPGKIKLHEYQEKQR